ncbi:MAG: hypothetical protein KBA53_11650 [Thermoclostridium sp.]|nr:hypothetical protein [Thermoclostridium sp.]
MLKRQWTSVTITTNQQANAMIQLFKNLSPVIGAMDTETTGLHIILDKPFIFQFGFLHPTENKGYTFLVDLEKRPALAQAVIHTWNQLATTLQLYLGHHILFDLHMCQNIDLPYTTENTSDTMFYIRYAHDAVHQDEGGPPLKLKEYTTRYIDPDAKAHEKLLSQERTQIAKELNIKLKQRLQNCGKPPAKYQAQSYTLGVIQKMFKDVIFNREDLEPHVRRQYNCWLQEDVPEQIRHKVQGLVESDYIPYTFLNRENLYKYAHYDIIYTLETHEITAPVVEARGNQKGVAMENSLLAPLFEMERVGFKIDKEYLEQSRIVMKQYIQERRNTLAEMVHQELSVGQHAKILEILRQQYHTPAHTTNADELDLLKSNLIRENPENPAIQFIDIIQELRTLEKWYSTYIIRFQKDLVFTDRLYTQINQVGAISGRVTSDFQQFPKGAIKSYDGKELFNPRKIVVPTGGEYDGIVYLDYSQIELRFQAFYTILVGHPDLNLCRAYMPYQCINREGTVFDYTNPLHIQCWRDVWFLCEDPKTQWTPVDVHAATTIKATGLSPDHPEFKKLRTDIGKRTNFAKNYGAQINRIRQMFPNKSEDEVRMIDNAYYAAFPGVKEYHTYCYGRAQQFTYTENLFGIRYYGVSGHKLINLLIQGSAAFYLKKKIREVYDYSKAHGIKSRWQMQIHDELSWEKHNTESEIFFAFQQIMQTWPDTYIPIVAEMEITKTNWAEKKGAENLEKFHEYFSH